jgi:predicted RNase H-like nuclease (RuvC/YqgF family)
MNERLQELNISSQVNSQEKDNLDNNLLVLQDKTQMMSRRISDLESINNQLTSKNTQLEMEVKSIDKENMDTKDKSYEMNNVILTLEHNLSHERQQLKSLKGELDLYKNK